MTLKLSSSVCGEGGMHTKSGNPPTNKGTGYRLCRTIYHRKDLGPAGELVYKGLQVQGALEGRQWTNDVQVNLLEVCIWNLECRQRHECMMVYFSTLAGNTTPGPGSDVGVHMRHQLLCRLECVVSEALQGLVCPKSLLFNFVVMRSLLG